MKKIIAYDSDLDLEKVAEILRSDIGSHISFLETYYETFSPDTDAEILSPAYIHDFKESMPHLGRETTLIETKEDGNYNAEKINRKPLRKADVSSDLDIGLDPIVDISERGHKYFLYGFAKNDRIEIKYTIREQTSDIIIEESGPYDPFFSEFIEDLKSELSSVNKKRVEKAPVILK